MAGLEKVNEKLYQYTASNGDVFNLKYGDRVYYAEGVRGISRYITQAPNST